MKVEEFHKKYKKTPYCWIWTGSLKPDGYGCLYYEGKMWIAHRVSYIIHKGKIPKGMFVLHKCDNPSCVNPKHLFIGTNKDNLHDMVMKDRGIFKLSVEDVLDIRRSKMSYLWLAKKYNVHSVTILRKRKFDRRIDTIKEQSK